MSGRIINATSWALFGQFLKLSLRLAVNLILARLLSPKEFGIVGMVSVIITLLTALGELGLFSSIIQRKDINQKDLSSVFWLNVILGFIITAGLFFATPLIVKFYHEEALMNVVKVMSLNFLLNSFMITHNAILTKELHFKRIEMYSLVSVLVSSLASVVLAYQGFGVWALVFGQNINYFINAVLIWTYEKWRPSFLISKVSLEKLLSFGLRIFSSAVLNTFLGNVDSLIIGRYFSSVSLGLYSYSQTLINIPTITFSSAFVRVLFPVMSEHQDDNERLRITYKKALNLVNIIIIPVMGSIYVFAHPLVTIIINPAWTDIIPYIRLFSVIAVLYPISAINLNILMAKGFADKFLKLEIIKKVLYVAGILFGLYWGVLGILVSILITSVIGVYFNLYISGKVSNYTITDQLKDLIPVVSICAVYILLLQIVFSVSALWMSEIFAVFSSLIISVPVLIILFVKFQSEIIFEIKRIIQKQFNLEIK